MLANVEAQPLFSLAMRLCGVGVLIQSLEVLWNGRELRDHGLLAWEAAEIAATRPIRQLIRTLHRRRFALVLLGVRAIAAGICVVIPYDNAAVFWLLGGLVAAQLYYNRRFLMLAGNSDTMYLISLSALFVGALPGGSIRLQSAALLFVAVHLLLAYALAGYDKLVSFAWRNGARLIQIFQDSSYRLPRLAAWISARPRRALILSRGVIALELLFPLCVALPSAGFWALVAGGLLFHFAVAVTMGLHGFWWSFLSGYPALWFVHVQVSAAIYGH